MNCQAVRQLFSTHLDGRLSPAEVEVLDAHLTGCAACVTELELARELCAALRENVVPVAPPPPGFARGVTVAIEERRRGRGWLAGAAGLVAGWRHGLVAAAAGLLIAAAALGYGAQQWLGQAPLVAQDDPPGASGLDVVSTPGTGPVEPGAGKTTGGSPGLGGVSGDNGQASDSGTGSDTGTGEGTDTGTAASPGETRPDREPGSTQVAGVPNVEQKVFLNKQRSIESTLLKVDVENLVRARDEAILLAGEVGASVSVQQVLDGGAPVEVLQFRMDSTQADAFIERLGALDRVVHQEHNSQDITERFATTLEKYRALVAKREQTADPDERAALDERIVSLEQKLSEWDQGAERYVVTLLLQQN